MRNRFRFASIALAICTAATLIGAGNPAHAVVMCADATHQGCWTVPFSPLGYPDPGAATEQQKLNVPAAASMVMMPNGRIIYWNGLQNLESCTGTAGPGGVTIPGGSLANNAGTCAGNSISELLDLTGNSATPIFAPVTTNKGDDLFCADQRLLENGQVFAAGGSHWSQEAAVPGHEYDTSTPGLSELYGSRDTHTFNPTTGKWTDSLDSMAHGRWYPAMLTLANGNEFITGGVSKLLWNSSWFPPANSASNKLPESKDPTHGSYSGDGGAPQNVTESEVYDIATGTWSRQGDNQSLPLFPRVHLLPDGEIFYTGAGQMWGPGGEDVNPGGGANQSIDPNNSSNPVSAPSNPAGIGSKDTNEVGWNWTKFYDPATKTWRDDTMPAFGARSGTFSAMLPLTPDAHGDYTQAQFLQGGGVLGTAPGTELATAFSEIETVAPDSSGTWKASTVRTGDMVNRRWFSSAVVLPNGQVLAFSGADKDEVVEPGIEKAVRQAELFDPKTGTWQGLGSSLRDRTYHNSAMLLPDGSVLVGGHAPINNSYGGNARANNQDIGSNNFKDPSFERFYPPYLFNGTRPVIDTAQSGQTWGQDLVVNMDTDSPAAPAKFILSRVPSVTHTTDADNRTIEIPFSQNPNGGGNSFALHIPNNANVVTPGYYYLFALSADGTPSVAPIVKIAPSSMVNPNDPTEPIKLIGQAAR